MMRRMTGFMLTAAIALTLCLASSGQATEPAAEFSKPPSATRDGGTITVRFGVSQPTDVAVYVLDAEGRVVRHLAAGVLGDNAPAPLKAGSLAQSLIWDGKDDTGRQVLSPPKGKPAEGGPFRVRVTAGMGANWGGTVFSQLSDGPNNLVAVGGLAVRPDGRVYVLAPRWSHYPRRSTAVHVYLRNGDYEKTIKPMPAHLSPDRLAGTGAFHDEAGRLLPVVHGVLGQSFYPGDDEFPQSPAVTTEGHLLLAVGSRKIASIDMNGAVPYADYAGGALNPLTSKARPQWKGAVLATGSDGKTVYFSGFKKSKWAKETLPAIWKTALPDRKNIEVFFGDPDKPGSGPAQLAASAEALTCDGKGRLVACDTDNGRVLVFDEKTAQVVSTLNIKASWAAIHPGSDALYAVVGDELVKYDGWKGEPKEVARVGFARQRMMPRNRKGSLSVALDAGAERPIVWLGFDTGHYAMQGLPIYPMQSFLFRVEDLGDRFGELTPANATPIETFRYLSANPQRTEVGCQINTDYAIRNETTGQLEKVASPGGMKRLGPDGNIYVLAAAPGIAQKSPGPAMRRVDRAGKTVPFPEAKVINPKRSGWLPVPGDGTTYWPRDFTVTRNGDVYVKMPGTGYHGLMSVEVFDKDGRHLRRVIWRTTDGGLGPRVDAAGNLYMGECVKTLGHKVPPFFEGKLPRDDVEYWWMYGSLVKFGPQGGVFGFKDAGVPRPGANPPEGLNEMKVSGLNGAWWKNYQKEMTVSGAKWMHYDFAFLSSMAGMGTDRCHCTATDFDVDDFGQSFYPDQGRFRVVVRDTNGNLIRTIGGYGNQDYCGPESYVPDPKTGFMRPRRESDPADLVSPFAQPEIAFNWFVGMCVTDNNLYVADGTNRRVVRVKLTYAADETCKVE